MADRIFSTDIGHGVTTEGYEEDGKIVIVNQQSGQSLQTIVDKNRQMADMARDKLRGPDDLGVLGGRVPILTHHKWREEFRAPGGPKEWGVPWPKFLKGKLQENKHFLFMKI